MIYIISASAVLHRQRATGKDRLVSRITPLPYSDARPEVQRVYDRVERRYGRSLDPVMVTAHSTPIFDGYIAFESGMQHTAHLEQRLVELVSTKVAAMIGCAFCIDLGSFLSQERGVTERQILEMADYATSDAYTQRERLAFDYAIAMSGGRVEVADDLFQRLGQEFTTGELVELTAVIAWENYRSRFNMALGMDSHGFSDGRTCALPERAH
ncbi:MAG: carboxymuconolactone decarboxylase family protein [Dehalococcoidia bacterium]|nr:MAG: carboxymuconolactone decarboxylase family protein [Dehalococcoidia bacterium]